MIQTMDATQTSTPTLTVSQVTRDFATILAETAEFLAFEQANEALQQDNQAMQLIKAYQSKQQSLYMMNMLGAVSPEDQAEIARLQEALQTNGTITTYSQCQSALITMCQEIGQHLSERIGLNFAAACGSSCCG